MTPIVWSEEDYEELTALTPEEIALMYTWHRKRSRGRELTETPPPYVLNLLIVASTGYLLGLIEVLRQSRALDDWQLATAKELKILHLSIMASSTGPQRLTESRVKRLFRDEFRDQLRFLQRLSIQLGKGKQGINGTLIRRVRMYPRAANGIYWQGRRWVNQVILRRTEERRLLHGSDHCEDSDLPGCVSQAALAWQPIGSLIKIGGCTCRSNCNCKFRFR